MSLTSRLAKLEKKHKSGQGKIIIAVEDIGDPNHLAVDGASLTLAEFETLAAQVGEDAIILHVAYDDKTPQNNL